MSWKVWMAIGVALVIGFSVKYWTCGEMFPHANRAACVISR